MTIWDPRACSVLTCLQEAGFRAVLVGGCVRDSLLDRAPHDFDVATSARPEQVLEACSRFHCLETGLKHGTVTVSVDHLPVEVTTFRREFGYSDHRRPDRVSFTDSLTEDLARRDFTINAIAWDRGVLEDPFGGREDLRLRRVRCVGDPDLRFEEDALRPLRGLRLAAQLDFTIEADTAAAIRRHVPDLSCVAWERISAEFLRLLCSPGAGRLLLDYPEAVARIIPELAPAMGSDPGSLRHDRDVYTHSVAAVDQAPPVPALRLAALLHDIGKPGTFVPDGQGHGCGGDHVQAGLPLASAALQRLRLPRALQERVLLLISHHHLPVEASPLWARRWLSRLGEEVLLQLLDLMRADLRACAPPFRDTSLPDQAEEVIRTCLAQHPCLTLGSLAVNGRDALAAGLRGPAIGKALQKLLEAVVEEELPNDRNFLLPRLHILASETAPSPDPSSAAGHLSMPGVSVRQNDQ